MKKNREVRARVRARVRVRLKETKLNRTRIQKN